MKCAKIVVAAILIASIAPLLGAGNESDPTGQTQARNTDRKGGMTEQTRSEIRDTVLDNLREIIKQNARSSARDAHARCGGMH